MHHAYGQNHKCATEGPTAIGSRESQGTKSGRVKREYLAVAEITCPLPRVGGPIWTLSHPLAIPLPRRKIALVIAPVGPEYLIVSVICYLLPHLEASALDPEAPDLIREL